MKARADLEGREQLRVLLPNLRGFSRSGVVAAEIEREVGSELPKGLDHGHNGFDRGLRVRAEHVTQTFDKAGHKLHGHGGIGFPEERR